MQAQRLAHSSRAERRQASTLEKYGPGVFGCKRAQSPQGCIDARSSVQGVFLLKLSSPRVLAGL